MKRKILRILPALALALVSGYGVSSEAIPNHQVILSADSFSSDAASEEHFTGGARIDTAFSTQPPQKVYGAYVTFEPVLELIGIITQWERH